MLVLVKPTFIFIEAGTSVTKSLNNITDKQAHVIEIITTYLNSPANFPGRQIQRLGTTNFLKITTLPDETADMIDAVYISKLRIPITNFMQQDELNVNNNLTFASLVSDYDSRRYHELTDAELNDAAVITRLKDNGQQLLDLNLEEVYLNDSHYDGANFFESRMNLAQMSSTTLIAATFNEATLQGANLSQSDLRHASFYNADLRGADLSEANGKEANFMNATLIGAKFINADLRHVALIGADLRNADLRGADLRNAYFDDRTNFTNCVVSSDTKFFGTNWEDTIHNDTIDEADFTEEGGEDDTDFEDDGEETAGADELAADADMYLMYTEVPESALAPLEISPDAKINNGSNITYENIVNLLVPKFNSVKIPISQMQLYNWYGIASLGTTPPDVWARNNVTPNIGTVFKCIEIPMPAEGEAIVYESTPACMAVHELSKKLDISTILNTFKKVIPDGTFDSVYSQITRGETTDSDKLGAFGTYLYKELYLLLGNHNADEPADAWTHVFDDVDKRKSFIKHAVFHRDEGIMHHPKFDRRLRNTHAEDLLVMALFIEELPLQVQVTWAQNYIKEFITGYEQELDTFDHTRYMPMGFIASCVNGNLEKFLLTISGAITHFYPVEPVAIVEDSADEKLQLLRKNITDSEFNKYFKTVQLDPAGPTLEGYKHYIETTPDLNSNEERRRQFLVLLEDPDIIAKIEETIGFMSGGRRRKNTQKKHTQKKTIKERKTIKKNKKTKNQKKKTIKKNKTYNKKKKTIKKKTKNKKTIKK
jgi:uncharacterized protein YjbI with pentapeptide repeats